MMATLRRWSALALEFALAKGLGQAAGMISGLIFARIMPIEEYALYALCMTAMAMISVGSDLGLTGSLGYFWRESLQGTTNFGPKLTAVQRLRSSLFFLAFGIAAVMLWSSTRSHDVAPLTIMTCLTLLAIGTWLQIQTSLNTYLIRLEGRQRVSYYGESAGSVTRLITATGMMAAGYASAVLGIMSGVAAAAISLLIVRSYRSENSRTQHTVSPQDRREIRAYLLPVLPGVAVYMVQDPLIMYLTSTLGGQETVAEVFALNRIAAVLALLGTFTAVVVVPRLARIRDNSTFSRALLMIGLSLGLVGVSAVAISSLAPQLPLVIIGPRYAHLNAEVVLVIATAAVALLTGLFALANRLRGWVALDPYVAGAQAAVIAVGSFVCSFESARDVVALNLVLAVFNCFWAAGVCGLGLRHPSLVTARRSTPDPISV